LPQLFRPKEEVSSHRGDDALVPDRSRIIVMVKMEGGFGPSVTLKRIYDRARESEPQ
jgi:hypothetical protein